jgi:hypothetical protein
MQCSGWIGFIWVKQGTPRRHARYVRLLSAEGNNDDRESTNGGGRTTSRRPDTRRPQEGARAHNTGGVFVSSARSEVCDGGGSIRID